MIDWTNCPDVESVPDRCGGQCVVKDSRVIVESCILGNAEDCSAEDIADMFEVPGGVEIVRRILAYAGVTALDYSDIPELGDEFFTKATHPAAPRYLTHAELSQDPWSVMRGLLPPDADVALLFAAQDAAWQVDGLILDAWRRGGFNKVTAWLLDLAHMSAIGRIAMLNDWRSRLTGTAFIKNRPYGEDTSYARAMRLRPEHLREVIAIVNETAAPP